MPHREPGPEEIVTTRRRLQGWPLALCFTAGAVWPHAAAAQGGTPQRHVEFVAPTAAGSSMDNVTRTVERLARDLKLVPVSSAVVNRPGGEHAVAYNFLKQRAGDPHFVGVASQVLLTNHISGVLQLTYENATFVAWRGVLAPHGISPAQIAYWEGVLRQVAESDDMRSVAERYQWEILFKGAAETRKFMEEEYARLKQVMTALGLVKCAEFSHS